MPLRPPPLARSTLLPLVLGAQLLAGGSVRADALPVVVAVDATLEPSARALAVSSVATFADGLAPDRPVALIVFDDVVRRVVPLSAADATQLDAMRDALDAPPRLADGNLAIGLERGLDELADRGAGHLLLFARARVGGADEESTARYRQWVGELLLPDAAARGIAITLISPVNGAEPAVLAELGEHPANASFRLGTDAATATAADTARTLQRRVAGGATVAAVSNAARDGGSGALDQRADDRATSPPDAAMSDPAPADAAAGVRWWPAVAALAAVVGLALAALALAARRRRREPAPTVGPPSRSAAPTASASSSYLPLHATPSRPYPSPGVAGAPPDRAAPIGGDGGPTTLRRPASGGDVTGPTRLRRDVPRDATPAAAGDLSQATRPVPAVGAPRTVRPDADGTGEASPHPDEAREADDLELLAALTAERTERGDPLD